MPAGFFRVAVVRRTGLSGLSLPSLGSGEPVPHARQDVDASSVTPAFGEPAETKKARYVVALSRVLRSVRVTRSRSFALGLCATTGTCEFGQAGTYARSFSQSRIFCAVGREYFPCPAAEPSAASTAAHPRLRSGRRSVGFPGKRRATLMVRLIASTVLELLANAIGLLVAYLDPPPDLLDRRGELHHRRRHLHGRPASSWRR